MFPRGCSYDVTSILKSGLITGETRKLRRKTENNDFWDNPDEEEPSEDFEKSRKIHHHSKRKSGQDAVNSINLAQAPDTGLQFWQTPCHICGQLCAGRLHLQSNFSKRGKELKMKRLSTLLLAPKIVSKSAWQSNSATWHQQNSTKTPSCLYPMTMIGKLDRCDHEKFFLHQAKFHSSSTRTRKTERLYFEEREILETHWPQEFDARVGALSKETK